MVLDCPIKADGLEALLSLLRGNWQTDAVEDKICSIYLAIKGLYLHFCIDYATNSACYLKFDRFLLLNQLT